MAGASGVQFQIRRRSLRKYLKHASALSLRRLRQQCRSRSLRVDKELPASRAARPGRAGSELPTIRTTGCTGVPPQSLHGSSGPLPVGCGCSTAAQLRRRALILYLSSVSLPLVFAPRHSNFFRTPCGSAKTCLFQVPILLTYSGQSTWPESRLCRPRLARFPLTPCWRSRRRRHNAAEWVLTHRSHFVRCARNVDQGSVRRLNYRK